MFLKKNKPPHQIFWCGGKPINEVEFDEIFLDSYNLPDFSKESFEGVVENPIPQKTIFFLGGFLGIFAAAFVLRIFFLEAVKGDEFYQRSETNRLGVVFENAERGLIYDRSGEPLAKNSDAEGKTMRTYPPEGFLHVLGFLTKEGQERKPENSEVGASGLEFVYEEILKGLPKTVEQIDRSLLL